MPTHIRRKGFATRESQLRLASEAMSRFKKQCIIEIEGDLIISCKKAESKKYHFEKMGFGNTVLLRDYATEHKKIAALRYWLVRRGYKRVGQGIYSKENQ